MSLFEDAAALPNGLVYQPRFIDEGEEARLIEAIRALDLREAQYKEFTAKRRVASFGASYDFTEGELTPAPQVAAFLLPLRAKAARWAGVEEEGLAYALVAEYRPGTQLGWHRDVPQFERVIGVSLGTACRMRFRPYPPRKGAKAFALELEPRSAYVLKDDVRWKWQHSIPPTPALRYSITFRSLVPR